jgi:carbamate kinase
MKKRIVIALGGNAIKKRDKGGDVQEQMKNIRNSCKQIAKIIQLGYEVILSHGNGPQIGNILIQQEAGSSQVPMQTMDICVAMTQGALGYMIQQALFNELKSCDLNASVISFITQTLVNKEDLEFTNPSKPVGPFYNQMTKERFECEKGYQMKQVLPKAKQCFRRVVPSPDPISILEEKALRRLVEAGMIVIASGGGGIPVIINAHGEFEGINAVIDKDLAAEKLAEAVAANVLMILTDVNNAKLEFGTSKEKDLELMNVTEAKRYLKEGHFLPGSMAPKVSA